MPGPTPLWLDCDPGHDDAFAIVLAAHHPDLRLLGVSTVHGNAPLARTTRNAGSVLTAIGRSDVGVYPGAERPFCRGAVHAHDIHGVTGIDGTNLLPTPASPPITHISALLAMRDTLMAQPPNTAWVVATGTLTNIAVLFAAFPELVAHVRGLSVMGGAIGGGYSGAPMGQVGDATRYGNITPYAEFNIYSDPEAARSIFTLPALAGKTFLVPLDVTHFALATPAVLGRLLHGSSITGESSNGHTEPTAPSSLRRMLHDLLTFFSRTYAEVFGITAGPPLHDPLAVAVVLDEMQKAEKALQAKQEPADAMQTDEPSAARNRVIKAENMDAAPLKTEALQTPGAPSGAEAVQVIQADIPYRNGRGAGAKGRFHYREEHYEDGERWQVTIVTEGEHAEVPPSGPIDDAMAGISGDALSRTSTGSAEDAPAPLHRVDTHGTVARADVDMLGRTLLTRLEPGTAHTQAAGVRVPRGLDVDWFWGEMLAAVGRAEDFVRARKKRI